VGDIVTRSLGSRAVTDPGLVAPVQTARLRLEPWVDARHGEALAELNADAEVVRFLTGGVPIAREESRALSREIERHWASCDFGLWAAVERAEERMLGFIGLSHPRWFPTLAPAVEVGWRLRREAWGRGFATEGGRAALEHGFGRLGLREVIALVHPENVRSAAVAERLGMRPREELPHPFRPHPLVVFATDRPPPAE